MFFKKTKLFTLNYTKIILKYYISTTIIATLLSIVVVSFVVFFARV